MREGAKGVNNENGVMIFDEIIHPEIRGNLSSFSMSSFPLPSFLPFIREHNTRVLHSITLVHFIKKLKK
jgi:hypothetical protein